MLGYFSVDFKMVNVETSSKVFVILDQYIMIRAKVEILG